MFYLTDTIKMGPFRKKRFVKTYRATESRIILHKKTVTDHNF